MIPKKKLKKKVPRGTSDYQASWILDEGKDWEDVSDEDEEDQSDEDQDMEEEFQPCDEESSQVVKNL